jgi:lysophospholipase L1-like esterase
MHKTFTLLASALCSTSAFAADYYVSPSGLDTAAGSEQAPFLTISKAAEVMQDGDTCHIMAGTYRESVDLSNKTGLTFQAFEGQQVTVTGLDLVEGSWTQESSNIWYTSANNLLTRTNTINSSVPSRTTQSATFESQVFKDGSMQFLARWPNKQSTAEEDLMEKDWYDMTNAECQASSPESFEVQNFPAEWTNDSLDGAYFWGLVQNTWSSWVVPISGYDSATKTASLSTYYTAEDTVHTWIRTKHNPNIKDRNTYYGHIIVLGAKALLDDENEFFTDFENDRLYVYSTTDPSTRSYEVKTRHNAFTIPATASNITIQGIDIKAATISIDGATDCLIQDADINFPSYGYAPYLNNMSAAIPGLRSLNLKGERNIIRDSKIENCFGGAFEVAGNDNYIHNCIARNVNTMASWHSGFVIAGERNTISHSTVSKVGRSGFSMNEANGCKIIYNDVSDVGYLTDDLGGLHSSRDVQNSEIAYNWFHDIQSGHAIYMDNYNSHYIVHHNVIWNTYGHGVNHNRPSSYSFIINNTVFENGAGAFKKDWTGLIGQRFGPWSDKGTRSHVDYDGQQADSSYGSMWFNNIARYGVISKDNRPYYGFHKLNNGTIDTDMLGGGAFDPAAHQVNSAADNGIYIKGITENVTDGKPDMGAYEITSPDPEALWVAGSDFVNPPEIPLYEESKLVFRNLLPNGTFYRTTSGNLPEGWTTSANAGDSILAVNYNGYNDPPANQRNSVYTNSLTVVSSSDDLTFAETTLGDLEPNKFYNFSAYVRLFPHEAPTTGVDDVTLYVKDSNGAILGTTTVKTFPNYSQDNRSTQQEWFMTEVTFQLPSDETDITLGFSTEDTGTFFIENVGICRKFSQAPKIISSTIEERVAIDAPSTFSIEETTDAEGDTIVDYRWTIDGVTYNGSSVQHTFDELSAGAEVTVVAIDEWGVESQPITRTVEVLETLPTSIAVSEIILDTEDLTADPVVITPSLQITVDQPQQAHDTLKLYLSESSTVSTTTAAATVSGISDFSGAIKLFIDSTDLTDGITYHYLVELSGTGTESAWSTQGSFTLDRLNMIPFGNLAHTHLASSDRRLQAGASLSTWQNLLENGSSYDAVAESTASKVGGSLEYSIKGMNTIRFDESGMKINTPITTGVTAFIASRRQAADVSGDANQRTFSVLGTENDFTASAGGWSLIKRVASNDGTPVEYAAQVTKKTGSTLRQGPLYLGQSANLGLNADFTGEIFEVVVYDGELSTEQQTVVQDWLNAKWTGSSFPQADLDWDGDGINNADETTQGSDPSLPNVTETLAWFSATQAGTELWWTVQQEAFLEEYRVVQNGQVVQVLPADKPDGGLYTHTLSNNSITQILSVSTDGSITAHEVYQQEDGGLPPGDGNGATDPNLPYVLIIGDSISIGYNDTVLDQLDGIANVIHNPGNAADTRYGLRNIDEWLSLDWDVIHFNFGLHDLKRVDGINVGVEIPDYIANLESLVATMQATGAKVIFGTTTPYPDVTNPVRYAADAITYNNAAVGVMNANNVPVNDLYTFMSDLLVTKPNRQLDNNVHFSSKGYEALGIEVANAILESMKDLDSDGIDDTWEKRHFGSNDSDPSADPDGDGDSNFHEFAFGGTPTARDASSRGPRVGLIPHPTEANKQIRELRFRRIKDSASYGLSYKLWRSSNLKDWTEDTQTIPTETIDDADGESEWLIYQIDNADSEEFYRIEALTQQP